MSVLLIFVVRIMPLWWEGGTSVCWRRISSGVGKAHEVKKGFEKMFCGGRC